MILVQGDLESALGSADLLLVTTNAEVTRYGRLIMGGGAARWMRDRFPGIDQKLGEKLRQAALAGSDYGLVLEPPSHHHPRLGGFQTKLMWQERSSLKVIETAELMLRVYLQAHPEVKSVAMNFPGIGLGKLGPAEVLPILKRLPDSVRVYCHGELSGVDTSDYTNEQEGASHE